ncbi:MAG: hypothetical protein GC206_11720 [Alphaproteobacteria bacterium]|nr:hypothetical protein [Alphaproteobacteria bacterium]
MRLDNQRRSTNVEYRTGGAGGGGRGGGGIPLRIPRLSLPMILIIGIAALAFHFLAPASLKDQVYGQIFGASSGGGGSAGPAEASQTCPAGQEEHCQFFEAVLGSTEDVWGPRFQQGALPAPSGGRAGQYAQPRLVVFFGPSVATACGTAGTDVGPFYCPADSQLYINPSFYDVMRQRLNAPGDFAQAYVIAHEVGHHVQNLIGATRLVDQARGGRTANQMSVRLELQADCLAGVWGRAAGRALEVDNADLQEALNAAHAIGDDTLQRQSRGYTDANSFTHGTSEQRMRWFRVGFESGDARRCDTFGVADYNRL